MTNYILLYREEGARNQLDAPLAFSCQADDLDHAEEQFLDANPGGYIVWSVETTDVEAAYTDFYEG